MASRNNRSRNASRPSTGSPHRRTADGFDNFAAKIGLGAQNLASASEYTFNYITRNRQQLEAMYRGSWLIGAAVDAPAEDMTRAGIDITASFTPDEIEKLQTALMEKGVWENLAHTIRWSRLFGGALAVLLIEGQDMSQPLRLDTITKDSFKGLLVLDRWMVNASQNDLVTDFGPNLGKPKFYDVVADAPALPKERIHYSRVVRFDGIDLPYFQRLGENLWGESVVERIYDRLVAFDSTSLGTAQLVYRAHLRTMKVKGYREIVAAGGPALTGLKKQIEMMRMMQSNEGVTLMDDTDTFDTHTYTFSGLSDVLTQMGEQVSGAVEVPLVRLFGQSPAGFSTGETDLEHYYETTNKKQESKLRTPLRLILEVLCRSELDKEPPEGFNFTFNKLKVISAKEKGEIGAAVTTSVQSAWEAGMIKLDTALRELRQWSRITGLWTNITDEEIEAAKDIPAPNAEEAMAGDPGNEGGDPMSRATAALASVKDGIEMRRIEYLGLPVVIETAKGEVREGDGWSVVMPVDYGYIEGTPSAEGTDEGMDVFVGPFRMSHAVYVIDQRDLETGAFDEHKCMLGYLMQDAAVRDYVRAYHDGKGQDRIMGVTKMDLDDFMAWVQTGDVTKPLADNFKLAAE